MLFDGTLTFEDGWFTGDITLTGTMLENALITITIDGVDYTGTSEKPFGIPLHVSIENEKCELTLNENGEGTDFSVFDLGSGDFPVKVVQVGGHEPPK